MAVAEQVHSLTGSERNPQGQVLRRQGHPPYGSIRLSLATHEQAAILWGKKLYKTDSSERTTYRTVSASEAPIEQASRPPTEHLQGIMERVTHHAEDSGYTVARIKVPSHSDRVTIVGGFRNSVNAGTPANAVSRWIEITMPH